MAERGGRESASDKAPPIGAAGLDVTQMLGIADALPMGLAYVGPDHRYRFVNRALADLLDQSRKTLIGRTMDEVLGAEAMAMRAAHFAAALAGERRWFAADFKHPTRGTLAIQSDYLPQLAADGTVLGVVILINDVTEQRVAERAIKESEERFRRIADSAPVMMWVSRLDRTRDFVNGAYAEFAGMSREEARRDDWTQAIHPDDRDRVITEHKAGLATGQPFAVEARFRRHDGDYRWLRSVSQPRLGPDGELIGFIGAATDITASKLAEEELRRQVDERTKALATSERRVRGLFDSALEMIALHDLDGSYLEVNRSALDSLGLTSDEIIGLFPWEIGPLADHPGSREVLRRLVEGARAGATVSEEITIDTRVGKATLLVSMKPVLGDDGKPSFLVGEGRDITELKLAQDQLRQAQKMEALGQLTGGMAHDFNNLLTVVVGGLDLIAKQVEDERLKRYAENALKAAERGARLTAQLLAFSRVQRLEVQPMDVNEHIDEMRPLLRNVLGPRIDKAFDLEPGRLGVMADPTQLEVAILNLAINARDAMPDGGTITLSTRHRKIADDPELEAGDYVELAITDTGTGMPPEVVARVFEPFFTTKEVGKGTGLGLSMVYGFAQQSGGTLRIDSAPGEGTVVRLLLRCAEEDVLDLDETIDAEGEAAAETFRILVVDDDEDVRRFIACSLEEYGHDVVEASNGASGLAAFARRPADLVILDYLMPGMTGAEVAATLRNERPDLPLLFVTGYSESDAIRTAAPDAAVMTKPFRPEALDIAVRDVMRQRKENPA